MEIGWFRSPNGLVHSALDLLDRLVEVFKHQHEHDIARVGLYEHRSSVWFKLFLIPITGVSI